VEALVRIADPEQCRRLVGIIDLAMSDNTSSWRLEPEGAWNRVTRDEEGQPLVDLQDTLRGDRHLRVVDG
jgi:polyphosphate kinase